MVKKIIHIADVHIRSFKRHDEFREVSESFFNEIKVLRETYEYDELRIAIVGDLVHQKITISNELVQIVSWFLNRCSELCPVIIIAGNHDLLENNKDRVDSITPIVELLNNPNIHYFKDSLCYLDENVVWCVYSIFEENERPDIESARKKYGEDKSYVGLFHAPLVGSKTDIGYEFEEGGDLSQFDGTDITLLGDIHLRQEFRYKEIPIVYCGSFFQNNFGEKVNGHGYLLWNLGDKTYSEHDIKSSYGYYQFKIKNLRDIENDNEILVNG